MIPEDVTCAKDTRELLIECCVGNQHLIIEFIHLLASESNDVCESESKKTISAEHVITALKKLGFEDYVEEIEEVLKEHKIQQKARDRKSSRFENLGLTEEELLENQLSLFKQARMKQQNNGTTNNDQASNYLINKKDEK